LLSEDTVLETEADQAIYANLPMLQPADTEGGTKTVYISASVQYCSRNTSAVTHNQLESNLTQGTAAGECLAEESDANLIQQDVDPDILTTTQEASLQIVRVEVGGEPYMVPGDTITDPSSLDGDGHPNLSLTTSTQLSPVQWLLQNFEVAPNMSIPRSQLYRYYLSYCNENKLKPLLASSLGKIVCNVFWRLRTRRLGKRGNSKYHYYGIRVIPGSAVSQHEEDEKLAICQQPSQEHRKFLLDSGDSGNCALKINSVYKQDTDNLVGSHHTSSLPQEPHQHLHLGDVPEANHDLPHITFPPGLYPPESCTMGDLDTFRLIYREHCAAILDAVVNLKFQTVECLWRDFWSSHDNNNGDKCDEEKYLSKTKLYLLCKCEPIQQFVQHVDCQFHHILVNILIPDVLTPIPSSLTQEIRDFTNRLESCLKRAMANCPEELMHIKVSAVSALAQTLRRYILLNHLAQSARPVFQNSLLIHQMIVDLNQVDFCNIQDQAAWVCQCDDGMIQQMEADIRNILHEQKSLEQWAAWLKGIVLQALKPYEGKSNFAKAARQLLLKWSFYTSLVMRDLTLRGAASFGSFYLIRLLCDEYMFFLVEQKVALETGKTPVAPKV
jgi:regulatory factor X 1/2/3